MIETLSQPSSVKQVHVLFINPTRMHYEIYRVILNCYQNFSFLSSINNFFNFVNFPYYQLFGLLPKKTDNDTRNNPLPTSHPNIFSTQPARSSTLSPSLNPATALLLLPSVQNDSVEQLIAQSKKIFAPPKPASATIRAEDQLTSAQRRRIEKNRQEAIRRREERLRKVDSELKRNSKSPRTSYKRSLNNQLRTLFMDGLHYTTCLACHKSSLHGKPPTSQIKIDVERRETLICGSSGNYILLFGE